jgi:hypothetical protein
LAKNKDTREKSANHDKSIKQGREVRAATWKRLTERHGYRPGRVSSRTGFDVWNEKGGGAAVLVAVVLVGAMVLAGLNLFGNSNFFKNSAEDDQALIWNGQRWVPSDQGLRSQTKKCDLIADWNAVGTVAWDNVGFDLGDAYTDDRISDSGASTATDASVRLYWNAGAQGDNVAKGVAFAAAGADNALRYGGTKDLFGNDNLNPTFVNSDTFGFLFSVIGLNANPAQSHYLYFSDFRFSIPLDATIVGVTININVAALDVGYMSVWSEGDNAGWSSMTISVTYREAP